MIDPDLLKTMPTAFELFSEQLARLVEELENLLASLEDIDQSEGLELLEERSDEFANKLHQIKGGAGFLKLQPITEVAARGEEFWKNSQFDSLEQSHSTIAGICSTLKNANTEIVALLGQTRD